MGGEQNDLSILAAISRRFFTIEMDDCPFADFQFIHRFCIRARDDRGPGNKDNRVSQ